MRDELTDNSNLPSSTSVLLEKLSALGVQASAIVDPGENGHVTIRIKRHDRDLARSAAITVGMKPLRIESRPVRDYDEILISRGDNGSSLETASLVFRHEPPSTREVIRDAELSTGGICIAISGGDGAGKSTAISMLHDWLHPTFRVLQLHFGRPRPLFLSSLLYRFLGILRRLRIKIPGSMLASENSGVHLGRASKIVLALQLLCLARDRRRTHTNSRVAVGSGLIVICDRYADSRISDMEGPRLRNLWPSPTPIQKRLVKFEERCYEGIVKPDVHIILRVSPEVARLRQPKDDPDALRRRVEAVARACVNAPGDVVVVDADAPLDSVHEDLRQIVWESL
jgi:thymidylate kinase